MAIPSSKVSQIALVAVLVSLGTVALIFRENLFSRGFFVKPYPTYQQPLRSDVSEEARARQEKAEELTAQGDVAYQAHRLEEARSLYADAADLGGQHATRAMWRYIQAIGKERTEPAGEFRKRLQPLAPDVWVRAERYWEVLRNNASLSAEQQLAITNVLSLAYYSEGNLTDEGPLDADRWYEKAADKGHVQGAMKYLHPRLLECLNDDIARTEGHQLQTNAKERLAAAGYVVDYDKMLHYLTLVQQNRAMLSDAQQTWLATAEQEMRHHRSNLIGPNAYRDRTAGKLSGKVQIESISPLPGAYTRALDKYQATVTIFNASDSPLENVYVELNAFDRSGLLLGTGNILLSNLPAHTRIRRVAAGGYFDGAPAKFEVLKVLCGGEPCGVNPLPEFP